jgi:probable rRNA maturation factor
MPQLSATIQYASTQTLVPTRAQFRKWAKAALRVDTEVTIRVVDADEGRMLNSTYRGKDYATNVLTFPITEEPHLMGDIIICAPVVVSEAHAQNKSIEAHYAHLTVHGILHLHGYDHEVDEQAALMEAIEVTTLQQLGYANPYLFTQDAKTA